MISHKYRSELPGLRVRQFGFTFVELILVIVVIGILGAVAAPRFFDQKGYTAIAFADQVRGLIRYGQKVAIAQNRNVYVRLDGASVALCYDSTLACTQRVQPPGGANSGSSATLQRCGNAANWACEGVPSGISVTSHALFYFDPMGKPFLATDLPPVLFSNFTSRTIVVSGDGLNHNVNVIAETGYVY